jgi:hypothetical protein
MKLLPLEGSTEGECEAVQATSKELAELIIRLEYSSGNQHRELCIRMVTCADLIPMFRFETWDMCREDVSIRFETSDVYAMQRRFVASVLDLYADGWKRESVCEGEPGSSHFMRYFDPRLYCAAEKPEWVLRGIPQIQQQRQTIIRRLGFNLNIAMMLVAWVICLPLLVGITRHFLPLVYVFIPTIFSILILLSPDKELLKHVRIGWRVVVLATGILYSGLLAVRR